MISRFVAAVALGVLVSTPAQADWQYTTWDMSPEEVVAASDGALSLDKGRPEQTMGGHELEATGRYQAGSRDFEAAMYFRNGSLEIVHLSIKDAPGCYSLANDLKGVYGEPFDESRSSVTQTWTWQDRETNNFVALLAIGSSCSLSYKELVSDDAAGL